MSIPKELINALPEDLCDVHIENEMDARRLLWLIQKLGQDKIRKSAQKYKYHPESKIFVSELVRRYRVKIPVAFYAPTYVKMYCVYIAPLIGHPIFKVGYSGRLVDRLNSFVKSRSAIGEFFDINRGVFAFVHSKSQAMKIEARIKTICKEYAIGNAYSLGYTPFGASGHKEWFSIDGIEAAMIELRSTGYESRAIRDALDWPDLDEVEMQGSC